MEEVGKFIEYLSKELNYSDNTVISYEEDINNYLEYLKKQNINYKKIDNIAIRNYLKYLDDLNLKNSTIARRISALRTFYNYLLNKGLVDTNLFNSIRNPKIEKKLPNYLSYEELARILDNIDISTFIGLRNRLMVEMFYATGCRVSEITNIKVNDIDKSNNSIRIMGKGSKERIVYFNARTKLHLQQYLDARTDNNPALFVSLYSPYTRLTISGVEVRIRRLGQSLSMSKVHPHKFRRTLATMAIDKGMPIEQVQRLLGHVRIDTTLHYAIVNQNNVKLGHKKYLG